MSLVKHYRLDVATLACQMIDGRRTILKIPEGSIIRVPVQLAGPRRLLSVEWDGAMVEMFASDILERGEDITNED